MPTNRFADGSTDDASTTEPRLRVTDESIVLKNYDSATAHTVMVRLQDTDGEIVFKRSYDLAPSDTVSTQTRLHRGTYTVEAALVTDTGRGSNTASNDSKAMLVGSGPDETALVELGNGIVSVSSGVI